MKRFIGKWSRLVWFCAWSWLGLMLSPFIRGAYVSFMRQFRRALDDETQEDLRERLQLTHFMRKVWLKGLSGRFEYLIKRARYLRRQAKLHSDADWYNRIHALEVEELAFKQAARQELIEATPSPYRLTPDDVSFGVQGAAEEAAQHERDLDAADRQALAPFIVVRPAVYLTLIVVADAYDEGRTNLSNLLRDLRHHEFTGPLGRGVPIPCELVDHVLELANANRALHSREVMNRNGEVVAVSVSHTTYGGSLLSTEEYEELQRVNGAEMNRYRTMASHPDMRQAVIQGTLARIQPHPPEKPVPPPPWAKRRKRAFTFDKKSE